MNRISVYWNLHTRNYSLKDSGSRLRRPERSSGRGGRVFAHQDIVLLRDCTFKVWEGGRQRVLREGQKMVHAFVCGTPVKPQDLPTHLGCPERVRYNPYETKTFVRADSGEPIFEAAWVLLKKEGDKPVVLAYP
jgi:hypothetical protein